MDELDRFIITVYLHPCKTRKQKLLKNWIYVHLGMQHLQMIQLWWCDWTLLQARLAHIAILGGIEGVSPDPVHYNAACLR